MSPQPKRQPTRRRQTQQDKPEQKVERAESIKQAANLREAIPLLRRPFTAAAIKFKIQTNPKQYDGEWSKAMVVCYMDSRLAAERLNAVCPGEWGDEYVQAVSVEPGVKGRGVVCRLEVFRTTRSDVGFDDNVGIEIGMKGLYSDAFKRAAVKFGIGAFLYAVPRLYVKSEDLTQRGSGQKTRWYLPLETEKALRGRYGLWLEHEGIERFGMPLDHGDVEDAQGDIEGEEPSTDPEVAEEKPAEQEKSADPEKEKELKELRKLYANSGCTKAVWEAKLAGMKLEKVEAATPEQRAELKAFLTEEAK